jgi:hypothetical protein
LPLEVIRTAFTKPVSRWSHQFVLDFTQEGILRKNDLFKVVFDPGADKREKSIPGQIVRRTALFRGLADFPPNHPVLSQSRINLGDATNDTGCVRRLLCPGVAPKNRRVNVTQLL